MDKKRKPYDTCAQIAYNKGNRTQWSLSRKKARDRYWEKKKKSNPPDESDE